MHATKTLGLVLTMLSICSGGCSSGEPDGGEEVPAEARAAISSGNGTSVNGTSINGTSVNGTSVNGTSVNGTSINGTSINGSQLVGLAAGLTLSGEDFIGAQMKATLSDGSTILLRIDDVDTAANDPEIFLYTVKYQDGAKWKSICGDGPGGAPIRAIPLSGLWDYSEATPTGGSHVDSPSTFTFACEGSTLAKCVGLGYKPWKVVEECKNQDDCHDVSLAAAHQACVRMVRADYCGDGMSHTTNGLSINLWDPFKVQKKKPGTIAILWMREAEWSPQGAECIEGYRWHADAAEDYVELRCPERVGASQNCFGGKSTFEPKYGFSTPLDQRSLIRNEYDALQVKKLLGQ